MQPRQFYPEDHKQRCDDGLRKRHAVQCLHDEHGKRRLGPDHSERHDSACFGQRGRQLGIRLGPPLFRLSNGLDGYVCHGHVRHNGGLEHRNLRQHYGDIALRQWKLSVWKLW